MIKIQSHFSSDQGSQNVIFCFAPARQNGWKGKIRDLKHQFERIWERETPQAPPPFVGFSALKVIRTAA